MTLNLIFTHPLAFSLCIMQNVNISITTFFFFIMHAFSIRFLKLLFPIPFNCRSIKLTYRILEVLFIRSGAISIVANIFLISGANPIYQIFSKGEAAQIVCKHAYILLVKECIVNGSMLGIWSAASSSFGSFSVNRGPSKDSHRS